MAVISGSDYRTIAVSYSEIRNQLIASRGDAYDAVYLIVQLNSVDPEVDLLIPFNSTYLVHADQMNSSSTLLGAVRALNQHVLNRGDVATVDAFLNAQGITVPQNWADLSASAGYTISSTYID
tara:strand:- start:302 stop:670 length:369 start_codon:yes stop_codon:yes gene_type:complete